MTKDNILHDFGEGLILRRADPSDLEEVADFNSRIHSDDGPENPEYALAHWTRDLFNNHPITSAEDFTVVEDTQAGKIVSTLCLISQTWTYGGIPFPVGRPELVGTDPNYRRRGLVRKQFEIIHRWSEERGEMLQAITGIPYYYRLFDYEMGLELSGGRIGYLPHIPTLKDDETEPYSIRQAASSDISYIRQLHEFGNQRYLVTCQRDENLWDFEINQMHDDSINRFDFYIIEDKTGDRVGYFACNNRLWGPTYALRQYELAEGISWFDVAPSVLRFLKTRGEELASQKEDASFQAFALYIGSDHPCYHVYSDRYPRIRDPYAYYIRIPDLPGFLQHIAPVLEERLAQSIMVGHTGELKISFYRDGIKIVFENGKIKDIHNEIFKQNSSDVYFPGLTFIQNLMGYRSIEEINQGYRDCFAQTDLGRAIMPILFPRQPSSVWPLS